MNTHRRSIVFATLLVGFLGFAFLTNAGAAHAAPLTTTVSFASNLSGTATLAQGSAAGTTIVTIKVTSKVPLNSTHGATIQSGSTCSANGPFEYQLNDVVFDANGNGTSTTTLTADLGALSFGTSYINVYDLSSGWNDGSSIVCGVINGTNATLTGLTGSITLTDNGDGTTHMQGTVWNLDSNPKQNRHALYIQAGTCSTTTDPSTITHALPEVAADKNGIGAVDVTLPIDYSTVADGNHTLTVYSHGVSDPSEAQYVTGCGSVTTS